MAAMMYHLAVLYVIIGSLGSPFIEMQLRKRNEYLDARR